MGQTPSVVFDPNTGQEYYDMNCCGTQGAQSPRSAPYRNQGLSTTDIQTFHPFIVQYMKLLSENLNHSFFEEFSTDHTIEQYGALDSELKEAARHLGRGLNLLLKRTQTSNPNYQTLKNPLFAHALGALLTTTIAESTKQVVHLAEQEKIAPAGDRKDMPDFCQPKDYFYLDAVKMTEQFIPTPYDRLKTMEPFILDNSIRESTVAQQRGHVKADKYAILHAVEEVGIKNIIVGSFGELPHVEDEWLEEMRREGKMKPHFWAFSELTDEFGPDGKPSLDTPIGLQKLIRFQVPNAIFELDIRACAPGYASGTWSVAQHCQLMKDRILKLQKEVSPTSKTFFNLRDSVRVFTDPALAKNLLEYTIYLAKLPKNLRPVGVLFEEPAGDAYPWQVRPIARMIRKAMDENDWKDGQLLIHVHKNYGFAEAVVHEALAHGCTGIWGGISEEGAGVGTANSLLCLTNLARYGNISVKEGYNFPRMYHAAKEICLITTGQEPHPKTELYGSRAMDILWNQGVMGTSDFDLHLFFDVPSPIRITTFTTPAMFQQHLAHTFGNHPEDWEIEICEAMRVQLHEDLLSSEKFNYQTPAGLYDLYLRAGGKKYLKEMVQTVVEKTNKNSKSGVADDHPLMLELKAMYDLYASEDGRMTYKNFFFCFINRFISCFNFPCPKFSAVVSAIDVDQSGDVDWPEISVWAKWAIEEYNLTPENCDIDRLTHMVFVGHIFPVAFQNLYQVKSRSKKHIAEVMSRGDED